MKGVYIVTSRMLGQRQQLTSLADNMANINTNGYKKLGYDFSTLVPQKQGQKVAEFSSNRGVYLDYTQGTINITNRPLDVALVGEGFFGVDNGGTIMYTRSGSMMVDPEGNLVTSEGYPVVDANNAAIQIPAGTTELIISEEGMISNQNGQIAQLGVFNFAPEDMPNLIRTGNGNLVPNGVAPVVNETPKIMQHALESSNVNPIAETVRMTEMLRAYQSAAKLQGGMEDLEQRAIRQLSQMP